MIVINCSSCAWQEECKTPCYEIVKRKDKEKTENFEEIFKKVLTKENE